MNMLRKGLSSLIVLIGFSAFSQFSLNSFHPELFPKDKWLDVRVKKSGPYIGYQRGLYNVGELGVERQWKRIKFKTAITHGVHIGFNYNFTNNVLGYETGYWIKPSRVGLTYGACANFFTDFTHNRIGVSPVIGYKLYGFHLQTGYHFLTPSGNFKEVNTFFISLRFIIVNDRDFDIQQKNPLFNRNKSKE